MSNLWKVTNSHVSWRMQILSALVSHHSYFLRYILTVILPGQCKTFLTKIGSIVFSDYRLIERFTNACLDDIVKFNCSRLDSEEEEVYLFLCYIWLLMTSKLHIIIERPQTRIHNWVFVRTCSWFEPRMPPSDSTCCRTPGTHRVT